MKPETPLHDKYADLLGDSADPQLTRLVRDLDTLANTPQPPHHLALSIEKSYSERARMGQQSRLRAPVAQRHGILRGLSQKLGLAGTLMATLLAALAITGAAYAVVPLLSSVFRMEDGLNYIDESKLGQEVHLSQTLNGWTINVERVYADANRIVVGYTTTGPNVGLPSNAHCTARDAATGSEYPAMTGMGNSDGGPTQASASSFDLGGLSNPPDVLNLTLLCSVSVVKHTAEVQRATTPSSGDTRATVVEAKKSDVEEVAGPFTFSVSVPVLPARIAEVNQTVEANGYLVTLERVIVAPSVTRAILSYRSLDGAAPPESAPIIELRANSRLLGAQAMTGSHNIEGGRVQHQIFAPLHNEQGEWTLSVTELVTWPGIEQGATEQVRVSGPWTFNFTLPPGK